jgi:hypothetical protein
VARCGTIGRTKTILQEVLPNGSNDPEMLSAPRRRHDEGFPEPKETRWESCFLDIPRRQEIDGRGDQAQNEKARLTG